MIKYWLAAQCEAVCLAVTSDVESFRDRDEVNSGDILSMTSSMRC